MKVTFKGTAEEIRGEMCEYLGLDYEQPEDANETPPPATEEAKPRAPRKQSAKAMQKAADLAAKAAEAENGKPPAPPAAPGESAAGGPPTPPDGRMPRPVCEEHAKGLDLTKFKPISSTPDRCLQCLTAKNNGGQAAAQQAPAASTADQVKAALGAVMDMEDQYDSHGVLTETRTYRKGTGLGVLAKFGAETVTNPKFKMLDPVHYTAVIEACEALRVPPPAADNKSRL